MMFDRLLQDIEKGISGDIPWIPVDFEQLGSQIGIAKRMYHLVGGDPGSGKTSMVDKIYVLDAYDWYIHQSEIDFEVIYFSMERSKRYKAAKWLAHRLYTHNNILIDVPSLLGWGTKTVEITPDIMIAIRSHEEYFNEMWKKVDIIDGTTNPTGIYKTLKQRALNRGIFYHRKDSDGKYYKQWMEGNVDKQIEINASDCPVDLIQWDGEYVPHNEKLITVIILDHIGKMQGERGFNEKQILDKTSEYLGQARDRYGYCVVPISQFNRNNANIQRRVHTDLSPEQQDFKGSGNMFEDADVVLALFNPSKHGLLKYKGYNIKFTIDSNRISRFRSISLLKNSYGMDNDIFGYKFVGENGYFQELKRSSQMQTQDYEELRNV